MSRPSRPKPAPAEASRSEPQAAAQSQATPDPANASQVTPDPTGAATEGAAAAAAPVGPKPDAKAPKPGKAAVVTVKGPAKGRWRAGRHFGPEPVEITIADLTEVEIERLKADPELTCAWPA